MGRYQRFRRLSGHRSADAEVAGMNSNPRRASDFFDFYTGHTLGQLPIVFARQFPLLTFPQGEKGGGILGGHHASQQTVIWALQ
jgi:hypothetical protein